jgi:hypothetical protein
MNIDMLITAIIMKFVFVFKELYGSEKGMSEAQHIEIEFFDLMLIWKLNYNKPFALKLRRHKVH